MQILPGLVISKIPDETQMLVRFTQDSLVLGYANNDEVLERMKYSMADDTLNTTKLEGISPCSTTASATYANSER